ncbi:MAG: hypothetical protein HY049_04180 [Acidobacteria bacterium]|nr:hypothetical protein [Acidobacteriota bacterium]
MSHSIRAVCSGALALVVLGAVSWARSCPDDTPRDGGTVVFAEAAEPANLNCLRSSDSPVINICRWVGDSLLAYDRDLAVVPRLASSYELAPDGRTLTFHLRKGVRWHDGKPFTADDVLYTIRQIRAPGARILGTLATHFASLESVTAPDEFTVVSRYREPYARAVDTWIRTTILPAHLPFEPGADAPTDRRPIGTGPFRFVTWDPQERIVLEANPDYFLGRPHLDRIVVRFLPDLHTRSMAALAGDVDISNLATGDIPESDAGLPVRTVRFPANGVIAVIWNVRESRHLFADARVRRALALGFDRQGYIDRILKGLARPSTSTFLPESWAHDPRVKPLPYDPDLARKLLRKAGWRDRDGDGILDTASGPAAFTLTYPAGQPPIETLAVLLQSSFKNLGLDVRLEPLEYHVCNQRVQEHQFEAAVKPWGLDSDPDPSDFFESSRWPGGQNFGGYASAEIDRLVEQGLHTMAIPERAAIYHRLEAMLQDEQPYMFVTHMTAVIALNRNLRGIEFGTASIYGYPAPISWWRLPAATSSR